MKLIPVTLLFLLAGAVRSVKVTCVLTNDKHDCDIKSVTYTNENVAFEIEAVVFVVFIFHYEDEVNQVTTTNSVFNFLPLQIFATFKNLRSLIFKNVKLKELKTLTNCGKLENLNVRENELKSIGKVFDQCTKLQEIYIYYNQIVSIDSQAFKKLPLLRNIYMRENKIEMISEGLFDANPKLLELDMSGNQIKFLPPKIFKSLTSLQRLYMHNNPFNSPHDISNHFKGLVALQILNMENCNIYEIKEGTFDGLVALNYLQIGRNFLSTLSPKIFDHLVKLEKLYLYDNKIVSIDAAAFNKLSNLKDILLHQNVIENIPEGLFAGLKTLERITIDYNNFTSLRLPSFGDLPKLKQFHIGPSRLDLMSSLMIKNFPSLDILLAINTPCVNREFINFTKAMLPYLSDCFEKVLNCNFNGGAACEIIEAEMTTIEKYRTIDGNGLLEQIQIKEVSAVNSVLEFIPQIIFYKFTTLASLELKSVRMKELRPLKNCSALTYLNLDDNRLKGIAEKTFEACWRLDEISLKDNEIISIQAKAFDGLQIMKYLHITNSIIKMPPSDDVIEMHANIFDNQTFLTTLHLSFKRTLNIGSSLDMQSSLRSLTLDNNEIPEITNETFKTLKLLERLDLSSNRISQVHENAFKFLISLISIDLSNNLLTSLQPDIFLSTFNVAIVTFDDNQFKTLPTIFGETKNLLEVSFNGNKLKQLASPSKLEKLKKLSLGNNEISSIAQLFFSTMPNLNELDLTGNECIQSNFKNFSVTDQNFLIEIKSCSENFILQTFCVFSNSKFGYTCNMIMDQDVNENIAESERNHSSDRSDDDVKFVSLNTALVSISLDKVFEKFQGLERVQLRKSKIRSIPTIRNCQKLRSFDMRFNELSKFSADVFANCQHIKSLILPRNEISQVSTIAATTLTSLDLSLNKLVLIPDGFFNSSNELKSLVLSHNRLASFSWVTRLPRLNILNLSHNVLKSVNFDIFFFQNDLKELHLNDNEISTIHSASEGVLQRLEYLNLENNKIIEFKLAPTIPKSLQFLDISSNKINSTLFTFVEGSHRTDFHAIGNICINETFENIENLNLITSKLKNCLPGLK